MSFATAALAAVLWLAAPALRASDAATLLEWRAPAGCPDARAVEQRLAAEHDHALAALASFGKVGGTIEPRDGGWLLTIELVTNDERSTRLIRADRCDDLADAAAVAIGLALEQGQQARADMTVEHAADGPALGEKTARGVPPEADAAPSPDGVAHRLAFAADVVMDVGSLPRLAPGFGVQAGVARERWQLALYGVFLPPRELSLGAEQGVDFSLLAGGARGCFSALANAFFPAACAGVELGRFSADGAGLRDARRADNLWLAPTAGLGLSPELWQGVSLDVRADALLPLIRKHYAVNDGERLFRPPLATLRFYLGLSLAID